ncbi:LacI family DNA-binding transcriptional regulator [Pararhizobium sp. IMCC21322]|uniref:LacI family DNA-binding transcriptional regulator n=1 Tax=Pararhizobium sp. IMCC21322 TaxID=3067903 RepID=UPI0027408AD9|nr:LacI family DNA-binding transcriptional regulator [Pararhizobium sp. IMCC21322]
MTRPRQTKTTVAEIAKRAGVSKATVDRVLNGRDGVQLHTRQHVLSTVRQLNGDDPTTPTGLHETVELDFVFPDYRNPFLADQAHHIESYCRSIEGVSVTTHHLTSATEAAVLQAINKISDASDGVGIIGVDTAKVRHALRGLDARNIPVVTLASDIRQINRRAYIGIDNYAAGRLAGYLMGKLIVAPRAKTAIILGLRAYLGHEEREMGFRSVLRDQFPHVKIVAEHEVAEDNICARDTLLELLKIHPDLNGIYCIGAGQTGIIDALNITDKAQSITVIGHGLTDDTRQYLIDGAMDAIINEDAEEEARSAVDHLVAAARGHTQPAPPSIAIQAIFPENIPL